MNAVDQKYLNDKDALIILERKIIAATAAGLPLCAEPYTEVAARVGVSTECVLAIMKNMLERGAIRRIAAVPNHYRLGYQANGMTVWDVADSEVDRVGKIVGQLEYVTHCYRRPRHLPGWPYNLFAMVHGLTRDEVMIKVEFIEKLIGDALRSRDVLFSKRILKKTGYRTSEGVR